MGELQSRRVHGLCLVFPAIILLSHSPLLLLHFCRLWVCDQYRYFPFVLVAFVCLVASRCGGSLERHGADATTGGRRWSRMGENAAYALSLILLGGAVLLWSPWLAAVAFILAVRALLRRFCGTASWQWVAPAWWLLVLLVPLPFRWDVSLMFWLQGATSQAGSLLLDFFGHNHLLAGHVIEIPGRQFLVEEACSGVRSLFALVALAAVYVVWLRRPLLHALFLLAASFFWAYAINTLRVAAVVFLYLEHHLDIFSTWSHELAGMVLFLLALWMLFCTDQLFIVLFAPIDPEPTAEEDETLSCERTENEPGTEQAGMMGRAATPALSACFRTGRELTLAGAFAGLGVIQLLAFLPNSLESRLDRTKDVAQLKASLVETTLPERLNGWQRVAFQTETRKPSSDLGSHSFIWRYAGTKEQLVVAFDFPFVGWHELTRCYRARGWRITEQKIVSADEKHSPGDGTIVEVHLRHSAGKRGYLLFSQFDRRGVAIDPPGMAGISASSWYRAIQDRVTKRLTEFGCDTFTHQVQMFVTSENGLSDERRRELVRTFPAVRETLLQRFTQAGE
ncbi:MAG: exosortase U [Pirellulaceae bacterium]|nr:exosortase U [Pirellulaceae bacterium]